MIKNLKFGDRVLSLLEVGNQYGNMNAGKAFYPEHYTQEMIDKEFLERRIHVGKQYGFDGHKMFLGLQRHQTGTAFEITPDFVEKHPDGWADIPEDILIVTDKAPGVVIGHPVADCPVVMAFNPDQKVVAISHCGASLVDKKMPMLLIDALEKAYPCNERDIQVYVSACAGKSWTYDKYPRWATDDKIWQENGIITLGEDGLYHIDLKKAVYLQLLERGIEDITMSDVDTILDSESYSNSAAHNGHPEKNGRNFHGAFIR